MYPSLETGFLFAWPYINDLEGLGWRAEDVNLRRVLKQRCIGTLLTELNAYMPDFQPWALLSSQEAG
eukprot:6213202-Pleurochrysis_carterae.AAC.3